MNREEKKKIFYAWEDTPLENRVPKYQSWLAKELNITTGTLINWRKERQETQIVPLKETVQRLGDKAHSESPPNGQKYDSETWLKSRTQDADRDLMKACASGNAQALKLFNQLINRLVEKSEQKVKFELSASEHFRIRREAERRISEVCGGANGDRGLLPKQSLLPQEVWKNKGQD